MKCQRNKQPWTVENRRPPLLYNDRDAGLKSSYPRQIEEGGTLPTFLNIQESWKEWSLALVKFLPVND